MLAVRPSYLSALFARSSCTSFFVARQIVTRVCVARTTTSLACNTTSRISHSSSTSISTANAFQASRSIEARLSASFARNSSSSSSNNPSPPNSPVPDSTATMAPIPPIFTLPIGSYKSETHTAPEGSITLTQPSPKVYLLTFNHGPDNRLTPPFLQAFTLALDILLTTLPPGVVITTSSIPKFYSNGLDYAGAVGDPTFMSTQLYPLWRKLLTFPWPTVALINGHAFAGGLMTAMAHDYRIMNPHKGFLCLNEIDFNAPLGPAMSSLFKHKLPMTTFRTIILEGKRFNALAAVEAGLIDGVGGVEETVKIIKELGMERQIREVGKGSYGLIKEEMYRDIIADLDMGFEGEKKWNEQKTQKRNQIMEDGKARVEAWKKNGGKLGDLKSKL